MKNKKTTQYQLTKQFLFIFLGILLVMNLFYLFLASKFVYDFVENKTETILLPLKNVKNDTIDWEKEINSFVTKDDALEVTDSKGNHFYSHEGVEIFQELYQGKSLPFVPSVVFSEEGAYYIADGKTMKDTFQVAVSMEDAVDLVFGMFLISLILNGVAIILGGVLIYFSVQKWSSKLSQMSKEIEALDITKDARITVPNNPVEMTDVATAFNQLLDEQKDAIDREKQFITNASHDLKTPLAAIRGHVSLIRRRGESHPEVIPTSIDFIDKESKRLERLSNQLLTLEKKDSSSFTMLNMSEIVLDEIEKIQSLTNRMFSSRVEADSMIEARRVDVQQVIQNLLENAVKYSVESSTIEVELRTNQSELLLEVRDEGIGISDENKKRIFERFYRVDASRTSDIEGSGIGLSIVKEIIDDYQGSIMIKDNKPKGTVFLVKLPKEKMKKSSSRV